MSVAYRLVCEQPLLNTDAAKVIQLAEQTEQVNALLESAKLKLIDDYVIDDFSSLSALAEELQVTFDDAPAHQVLWFDASEGLQWIEHLNSLLQKELALSQDQSLISDIQKLKENLQQAEAQGTKWRLQVDLDA